VPVNAPDGSVVIITFEGAPTLSAKLLEVAAVSNVGVKLRVKFPGVPERTRLVKVATPLTAATVVVPLKVPVPEAIEATTLTVEVVAVFPGASVTRTTGWVISATPLTAPDGWVVIAACVAAPALSAKLLEVAAVSDVGVKVRVKLPAVPERTRLVKVATPLTAATVVVPLKVPVPEAIDATTLTVDDVTVFPEASVILITGWVVRATPLAAPDGSVVIAACVAAPTLSAKLLEVAAVNDVGVNLSVKLLAVPERTRLVKVATPLIAATVVVPLKVPVPEAIDATTLTVDDVTVFPEASVILITGWVVKATPAAAPDGWVVIAACVAAPTPMAKLLEVAAVSDVGVKIRVKLPAVPERTKLVKVATPLTAATVVVPLRVPPVPDAIDATTLTVEVVTVFPDESVMRTTGWVVKATPAAAPAG
jgi:hypothetical protein